MHSPSGPGNTGPWAVHFPWLASRPAKVLSRGGHHPSWAEPGVEGARVRLFVLHLVSPASPQLALDETDDSA